MDGIIFNDLSDFQVPARSAGAYRIAGFARNHGLRIKVIDYITHGLKKPRDLYDIVKTFVTPDTKFFGFATTFMAVDARLSYFVRSLHNRFPNVKIIFGGQSDGSAEFAELCDDIGYQIHGYGEDSLLQVLGIKANIKFRDIAPMFHVEDNIKSCEVLPIELSRGCRFKCKFCAFPLLGRNPKNNEYLRSYDSIFNEIRHNYESFGTTRYFILCDTFNETTEKLMVVKRAIDELGIDIQFSAYIRLDLLYAHPEQVEILHDMGIRAAFFGIESFHDPSSKAIGKGLGFTKTISALAHVKEAWPDTQTHGNFIIGLPHETHTTANEWCNYLVNGEIPVDSWRMNGLSIRKTPINASEFEKNATKYGYLFDDIGWFNDHWTQRSADAFALSKRKAGEGTNGVTSWQAMGMLNYDLPWGTIRSTLGAELNTPRYHALNSAFMDEYYKNLLAMT
mgnify:CR=1 FL=1|jgi:hypothetical protein|tara:strand:- start:411 stop:1760 length:1350 start_codon:yes stop_codon:yes gene_type:complete